MRRRFRRLYRTEQTPLFEIADELKDVWIMEKGFEKIKGVLWFICFVLVSMGATLSIRLGAIESNIERIAGPGKPIVKIERFDKEGKVYEVDATVEVVSRDGCSLKQTDPGGYTAIPGVSFHYKELSERRYSE